MQHSADNVQVQSSDLDLFEHASVEGSSTGPRSECNEELTPTSIDHDSDLDYVPDSSEGSENLASFSQFAEIATRKLASRTAVESSWRVADMIKCLSSRVYIRLFCLRTRHATSLLR